VDWLVVDGGRPVEAIGKLIEPTLFADVDNGMTIAQEEIFGPVLVVIPFDDDAVRIGNDSSHGLSGTVTTGSRERPHCAIHHRQALSLETNLRE
jgi:aldehyde dehydrogenase (NAD+)